MRSKITGKRVVQIVGCAAFCLLVYGFAFLNRTLVMEPTGELLRGQGGFADMTREIQSNYLSDRFRGNDDLISLNGGYARITGRTQYNGVQKMTNGMLTGLASGGMDTSEMTDNLERFCRSLERKGIPFLFVMAPFKVATAENLLPTGVTDTTNAIADQVLAELAERNVPFLDLRPEMSSTRAQVDQYFYRTDHHWNVEGAFYAYRRITEAVQAFFPETKTSYTDAALWEKTVVPNWWLGSSGRRVGPLFGGAEDLDYYLPAFETEMSRYSLGRWAYKGDFRRANICEEMLEKSDYYLMDTYDRYLGGGYALTYHRNQQAENRLKLFILRDSFMIPTECFLSAEFTYLDVLDSRGYGRMSEADYVTLNEPDMVLLVLYPGSITTEYFQYFTNFGEARDLEILAEESWKSLRVPAAETAPDAAVLSAQLHAGRSYVLTLDHIQTEAGAPEGASVILYDGDRVVDETVFDIEYGNAYGFRWGFQIPESQEEGQYELRFYAGIANRTEGVTLEYQGIRLQECLLTVQE